MFKGVLVVLLQGLFLFVAQPKRIRLEWSRKRSDFALKKNQKKGGAKSLTNCFETQSGRRFYRINRRFKNRG